MPATGLDDDDHKLRPVLAQVISLADTARVAEAIGSEDGQSRDFVRALDAAIRSGDPHSLGVLKIEFPTAVSGNGTRPTRDDDHISRMMRSWGQRSGATLSPLDKGRFAVLLPGSSAPAATKLLADWCEMLLAFEYAHDRKELEISLGVREFSRRTMWSFAPRGKAHVE
jgi:hypothetical protein